MRVAFVDNGGKGALIRQALVDAGHDIIGPEDTGDVALVDHCATNWGLLDRHPTSVLYPHGGNVCLDFDGHLPLHPHVRVALVHGPGHAEVMAAYGFGAPCVPVGWCYSGWVAEMVPWPGSFDGRKALLAPAHPNPSGYLAPHLRAANRHGLERLLAWGCDVTVRLWPHADAEGHGLDPDAPARWTAGDGLRHADIDNADVVAADNGTVAHLALARGVPVWMIDAYDRPDLGHDGPVAPAHWGRYAHLMRYVLSSADAYRHWFCGGPFQPDAVVRAVESAAAWS